MGGTGSSERMSAYLASLGISEPYPTVLAFWGQSIGSKEPLSRLLGGGGGGGGRCEWLSTPPTYVSCVLPLFCIVRSPVPVSPFKWNVPLALEAQGRGRERRETLCSRKAFFLEPGIPGIRYRCRRQVEEMAQGQQQRKTLRTRQSWTHAHSPSPGDGLSWRLEGNRHLLPLWLLEDPPLRRHMGTLTGWGEK